MPYDPPPAVDWNRLYVELSHPFPDALIKYRVGAISRDQKMAQALAFAPVRVYEDRLNELVPGAWSVEFEPWGEARIVCRLTIHDVTRSSTGDGAGSPDQIAGTAAEAQAFKRACSKFGLGRHLYELPVRWLAYDATSKTFVSSASTPMTDTSWNGGPTRTGSGASEALEPTGTIGRARAAAMAMEMARWGIARSKHLTFAGQALGRRVDAMSALTEPEARRVWRHVQKTRGKTSSA